MYSSYLYQTSLSWNPETFLGEIFLGEIFLGFGALNHWQPIPNMIINTWAFPDVFPINVTIALALRVMLILLSSAPL